MIENRPPLERTPPRHIKSPADLRAWRKSWSQLTTFLTSQPRIDESEIVDAIVDLARAGQFDVGWTKIELSRGRVGTITPKILRLAEVRLSREREGGAFWRFEDKIPKPWWRGLK